MGSGATGGLARIRVFEAVLAPKGTVYGAHIHAGLNSRRGNSPVISHAAIVLTHHGAIGNKGPDRGIAYRPERLDAGSQVGIEQSVDDARLVAINRLSRYLIAKTVDFGDEPNRGIGKSARELFGPAVARKHRSGKSIEIGVDRFSKFLIGEIGSLLAQIDA